MGERAKVIVNDYTALSLLKRKDLDIDKFYSADLKIFVKIARQEIDRLNNIINNFDKLIDEVKEKLDKRVQGESYIYNYKGEMVTMDVGYAWEGIEFFIEELKHKLKEGNNE